MPMGLGNIPTFQRLVDNILGGIKGKFTYGYIDDIIIFSDTFKEHLEYIREFLKRLVEVGLRVNKLKCEFAVREPTYLGYLIAHNTTAL